MTDQTDTAAAIVFNPKPETLERLGITREEWDDRVALDRLITRQMREGLDHDRAAVRRHEEKLREYQRRQADDIADLQARIAAIKAEWKPYINEERREVRAARKRVTDTVDWLRGRTGGLAGLDLDDLDA